MRPTSSSALCDTNILLTDGIATLTVRCHRNEHSHSRHPPLIPLIISSCSIILTLHLPNHCFHNGRLSSFLWDGVVLVFIVSLAYSLIYFTIWLFQLNKKFQLSFTFTNSIYSTYINKYMWKTIEYKYTCQIVFFRTIETVKLYFIKPRTGKDLFSGIMFSAVSSVHFNCKIVTYNILSS